MATTRLMRSQASGDLRSVVAWPSITASFDERRPPGGTTAHLQSRNRRLFIRETSRLRYWHKAARPEHVPHAALLLYGAGLRFSEATGLLRDECDLKASVLTIRDTKFYRAGWCPLNAVGMALARHLSQPPRRGLPRMVADTCCRTGRDPAGSSTVQTAFDRLRRAADVRGSAGGRQRPACMTSVTASRFWADGGIEGADVQRLLPVLSTYLGHSDLNTKSPDDDPSSWSKRRCCCAFCSWRCRCQSMNSLGLGWRFLTEYIVTERSPLETPGPAIAIRSDCSPFASQRCAGPSTV